MMIRDVPPKGNIRTEYTVKEVWDHLNDDQTACSDKDDIVQNLCQIIYSRFCQDGFLG